MNVHVYKYKKFPINYELFSSVFLICSQVPQLENKSKFISFLIHDVFVTTAISLSQFPQSDELINQKFCVVRN